MRRLLRVGVVAFISSRPRTLFERVLRKRLSLDAGISSLA